MRLCGISSRFQLLSPCIRQVAHALLTRPPLSHTAFQSENFKAVCFVRLACVKHAASVHPEPGSNSLIKFRSGSKRLLACPLVTVLKVSSLNKTFKNFQGCVTVQLSMCFAALCDSLYNLSPDLRFVNRFFIFLFKSLQALQLRCLHRTGHHQNHVPVRKNENGERGI